jgi:hypothetical protein
MSIQAGDLGVEIDTGLNRPGAIVQRLDGEEWRDYLQDGKPVVWPVKEEELEPGRYRVLE